MLVQFLYSNSKEVPTSTRAQSKTSMGSPPNCSGPTNMDIEEPQFVRIVLLAFKESPVKGSPFGLSLFVPLWSSPRRWDVQKNFLLVGLRVKASPCCRPLCLSGTSMIVDLSMGQSCNFPMHISKARGGQFFLISLYRRKFRSQTPDNMDRWKAEMERVREKRRERLEERRVEEKESEERRCRCAKR